MRQARRRLLEQSIGGAHKAMESKLAGRIRRVQTFGDTGEGVQGAAAKSHLLTTCLSSPGAACGAGCVTDAVGQAPAGPL